MANETNRSANGDPTEKDFHEHLHPATDPDTALRKIQTAGSISISPELFEKIYLSPQNAVKGDLRKTFANPTPLALVGFLLALTPLTCDLMNWRGAQTGNGSASIGAYFFFGGLLMVLGSVGEFFLGNTFPCIVFGSFGAFWLTFGATLQPFYSAYGNYSTTGEAAEGLMEPTFNNAFGFFLLWMGVLCFIYLICSLRTNLVFVGIFFTLVFAFPFLTAGFWYLANGLSTGNAHDLVLAKRYIITGGAFAFVTCVLGWWIFTAIMLAALDFPFQLPVGDLSRYVKGASEKSQA